MARRNESKQTIQTNVELFNEELVNKVCADFASKIEAKIDKKFEKLYDKLNDITKSLSNIGLKVANNQKAISSIENTCDALQQLTKRSSLRIQGLQEERAGETVLDNVVEFFKKELCVNCTETDIDSVFRIGQPNEKSRTVIVNFVRYVKRCEVLNAKKNLKDKGVSIFEDLTKARYGLLIEAKKKFGNKKAWSAGGKIYIWKDNENRKYVINCDADLQLY